MCETLVKLQDQWAARHMTNYRLQTGNTKQELSKKNIGIHRNVLLLEPFLLFWAAGRVKSSPHLTLDLNTHSPAEPSYFIFRVIITGHGKLACY